MENTIIQKKLDELVEDNEELQNYVSKLYYVVPGDKIPLDATHTLSLASVREASRALNVAAVCVPEFALKLEAILALIAVSQAPKPSPKKA